MAEHNGVEVARCPELERVLHEPHEWTYKQDWGPQRNFQYWCWGIKSITIETWESDYQDG